MGKTFLNAQNNRYTVGSATGLREPFTVCGVYRCSAAQSTSNFRAIWGYEESLSVFHRIRPTNAQTLTASSQSTIVRVATSPANEIYDAYNVGVGVWASSSSRVVWLNNGSGSDTGSATVAATDMTIGNLFSTSQSLNGDLAEVAIWDTNLNTDEINALSKGFKPFRIRPQSLWLYVPFIRDVHDLRAARTLTLTGNALTTVSHPRVY
jgi:hypothetical protein